MIEIGISAAGARLLRSEVLTSGRVGLRCRLRFDSAWDGLQKTVVVAGSRSVDLRKVSRDINAGISGRGGGRPEMIQGSATAPEDQIRSFILGFQG